MVNNNKCTNILSKKNIKNHNESIISLSPIFFNSFLGTFFNIPESKTKNLFFNLNSAGLFTE